MDSTAQSLPIVLAKVAEGTFIGIHWGGVVLTLFFFAFRIYVRMTAFGRVYVDDALVLAAWLMFLVTTIIWQVNKGDLYENIAVSAGQINQPSNFAQFVMKYLRASIAVNILFYSCLWSIKVSCLIFFRRLGQKVRGQSQLWLLVLAITLMSYFACLGTIDYKCLGSSFSYIESTCPRPDRIQFQTRELIANMVIDVVTDVLVMTVPVSMLWKVQISLRQKLVLAGIFSLTVFIMVFAIIRVAVLSSSNNIRDQTWLYLWSAIEQTVAITVACLASFRALFVKHDRTQLLSDCEKSGKLVGSDRILFDSEDSVQTVGYDNVGSQLSIIRTQNDSSGERSSSVESTGPTNRVHMKSTVSTFFSTNSNVNKSTGT